MSQCQMQRLCYTKTLSMIQKIEFDKKQVSFKASASIPRIYRIKFHHDIYKDLDALGKTVETECADNYCKYFSENRYPGTWHSFYRQS